MADLIIKGNHLHQTMITFYNTNTSAKYKNKTNKQKNLTNTVEQNKTEKIKNCSVISHAQKKQAHKQIKYYSAPQKFHRCFV